MTQTTLDLPRNISGRFVPSSCPNPLCSGRFVPDGDGNWYCDGLFDPGHEDLELEPCMKSLP